MWDRIVRCSSGNTLCHCCGPRSWSQVELRLRVKPSARRADILMAQSARVPRTRPTAGLLPGLDPIRSDPIGPAPYLSGVTHDPIRVMTGRVQSCGRLYEPFSCGWELQSV